MRYKNLTITITLGCLSLVALAGLVLLPISNGVCELRQYGWTPYNDYTAANILVLEDTKGAAWKMRATVDAKGVSAEITPEAHNPSHFTEDKTFTGTGMVTAIRGNYTVRDIYRFPEYNYVREYFVSGDTKTNNPDSRRYYNGEDTALTLDIEANAKVEKHTCVGYKKGDSNEASITVPLELDIPKIPRAGIEFQGKIGSTKYISKDESIKVHVYRPVVDQEIGVKTSVDFDGNAVCAAFADFDFNEEKKTPIEFDEGSVWYFPPD